MIVMTKDEQIAREYRHKCADVGGMAWWDHLNNEDTYRIDQDEDEQYTPLFE
jgi:hypothetical protein